MEERSYSRSTGKFRRAGKGTFPFQSQRKKDEGSVCSVDEHDFHNNQHPIGNLSPTQPKYIQRFLVAMTIT